jgi:membrane-bound lytic murein transglycosylase B
VLASELVIAAGVISVGGPHLAAARGPASANGVEAVVATATDGPLPAFAAAPVVQRLAPAPALSRQPATSRPPNASHRIVAAPPRHDDNSAAERHRVAPTVHRRAVPEASAAAGKLPKQLDVKAAAIPAKVRTAYRNAVAAADAADRQCRLQWQPLAAIGYVESDNARAGASANPLWNGVAFPPIVGPVLDGRRGTPAVPDTDHGSLDGDSRWDRAVGPMQFLPATWARYAADGDGDGVDNPQDIGDASLAAADFLCAAGSHLNEAQPLSRAVHSYTHSYRYVRAILTVAARYEHSSPVPRRGSPPTSPPSPRSPSPSPAGTASTSPTPSSDPTSLPSPRTSVPSSASPS